MQKALTQTAIKALQPAAKKFRVFDAGFPGFGVTVLPNGKKIFLFRYRVGGRAGRLREYRVGEYGDVTLDQARRFAEGLRGDVVRGVDPMANLQAERREQAAKGATLKTVLDDFVQRYAMKRNRAWKETDRIFRVYVLPRLGDRTVHSLRRADIVALLDHVADHHGEVMADRVLAQVRKALAWFQARDDEFVSPVVRGLGRSNPVQRQRTRVLHDEEIRLLWKALDAQPDHVATFVKLLLLTGQRRTEVARMHAREIDGDQWLIPPERMKGKRPHIVPLTGDVIALINRRKGFIVSSTSGLRPFSGFSKAKASLDAEMLRLAREVDSGATLKRWTYHDLRRTVMTTMRRCGVDRDVASLVEARVIPGVARVYDRYEAMPERRHALETLADEMRAIVQGETAPKVVRLRQGGAE